MPLSTGGNYRRGAVFERKVAAQLVDDGYWVARAAGSHGKADLVAIKIGEIVLVNCKLPGPGGVPPAEWNALWDLAERIDAVAVVAYRPGRGRVAYARMVGPKRGRTRIAPARPWSPDNAQEVPE